jgi:hemerythrin
MPLFSVVMFHFIEEETNMNELGWEGLGVGFYKVVNYG